MNFFNTGHTIHSEDMKVVDWKVFAKREELVAKTFQEDTNFNLFLVLDTSASMGYKGAGSSSTNCTTRLCLLRALLTLP